MYTRICKPLLSNSFFLFGSRGTGKSTLLRTLLPPSSRTLWLDLLDEGLYAQLLAHPEKFIELIPPQFSKGDWVVVDEIQRVPSLLNAVHQLIEEKKLLFALTGSSARKLKRGGANLLAGRAFLNSLHPLTAREIGTDFQLNETLQWGSLPKVLSLPDPQSKKEFLKSYVGAYLREEIKEEQVLRRLDPFVRFLEIAAQTNGQILNAAKVGRDARADGHSVIRYFQILEDTLLGFFLEPYHTSARKVQTAKAKFYLFDLGVKRALEGSLSSELTHRSSAYGKAFEHFFLLECKRLSDAARTEDRFYYARTKDDVEIDLLIERSRRELIAIEVKSSEQVDASELRAAHALANDLKANRFLVVCREKRRRMVDGIEIVPWQEALTELYPLDL